MTNLKNLMKGGKKLEDELKSKPVVEVTPVEDQAEKLSEEQARIKLEAENKEQLEKEQSEKERIEKERLEKEQLDKEQLDKQKFELDKKDAEEKERTEKERLNKLAKEKAEADRLEAEKEKARLENVKNEVTLLQGDGVIQLSRKLEHITREDAFKFKNKASVTANLYADNDKMLTDLSTVLNIPKIKLTNHIIAEFLQKVYPEVLQIQRQQLEEKLRNM
jgi:exonuclease VII large subunit